MRGMRGWTRRTALVVAACSLGGCALLGRGKKDSPQVVAERAAQDTRIRGEVEARVAAEPALAGARLRVDVHDREVSLYGSVPGMGALRCATANVELVQGVRLVIDHTELLPGPATAPCRSPRVLGARAPGA